MTDVLLDRAQSYRKRAAVLRALADGMVQSGGNGDMLRRLALEYDKMAAEFDDWAAKEKSATQPARNLSAAS
jgi:hypothetical protein